MSQMIKTAYGYVSLTEAAICADLEGWLQKKRHQQPCSNEEQRRTIAKDRSQTATRNDPLKNEQGA
ncbi:hypothetical protein ACRYI5_01200 [Furfurilactobacillus sp. WILCCON 0119]|uniref:hypothetical protein n=1 Tax=Furfurilactobacillus entadae TaxID=2922307 RepID=UPI0035E542D5